MTTAVERFDDEARRRVIAHGRTTVREGELLRHPVYTRVLHWAVAIFFLLALLSGFAIYTPWLYHGLTPLFGGGPMTRLLHPWFSLGFVAFFALQFLQLAHADDVDASATRAGCGGSKTYVTNEEKLEPEYVDFFNGGQKTVLLGDCGQRADLPAVRHPDVVSADLRPGRRGRSATSCTTSPRSSCWSDSSSTSTKARRSSRAPFRR